MVVAACEKAERRKKVKVDDRKPEVSVKDL